jgi:hypothetical protein
MWWLWIRLVLLVVLAVVPSYRLLLLFVGAFAGIYLLGRFGGYFSVEGLIRFVGLEIGFFAAGAGVIWLRRRLVPQGTNADA